MILLEETIFYKKVIFVCFGYFFKRGVISKRGFLKSEENNQSQRFKWITDMGSCSKGDIRVIIIKIQRDLKDIL